MRDPSNFLDIPELFHEFCHLPQLTDNMALGTVFVQSDRHVEALCARESALLEGARSWKAAMTEPKARDYSETLFLPKTDFPMRAGLPQKEPEILARWHKLDLYGALRAAAKGRPQFVLHDGPPYANGNIHIGHALNKILKDVVTRSQQMLGSDSQLCAGLGLPRPADRMEDRRGELPRQGQAEADFSNAAAFVEFRRECRAFAAHWIEVQRDEFERLGVTGDWAHPYTTMDISPRRRSRAN